MVNQRKSHYVVRKKKSPMAKLEIYLADLN